MSMSWLLNLWRRVRPTMPIGENILRIEEFKIQGVNLTVKDSIEAVTFYLKVNTQRIADPSRYSVIFHIVEGWPWSLYIEIVEDDFIIVKLSKVPSNNEPWFKGSNNLKVLSIQGYPGERPG